MLIKPHSRPLPCVDVRDYSTAAGTGSCLRRAEDYLWLWFFSGFVLSNETQLAVWLHRPVQGKGWEHMAGKELLRGFKWLTVKAGSTLNNE